VDQQNYYSLDQDKIFSLLNTNKKGLTESEVLKRLNKYGPNALTAKKKISAFQIYLGQFKNTLTLILIAAAILILFIYFFGERDSSDLIESGLILSIILMITILGFIQEFKAEKAVESLKKLLAFKALVIRDGVEKEIDVKDLVPGDIVRLEEGLKVPADIRIIEEYNLSVIEASLTGESTPVSKTEDSIAGKKGLPDQKNMVFSGTSIASGRGIGVVIGTGDTTEIGKIADMVSDTEEGETPIQKKLDQIGKMIGYIVIAICAGVFVFIMFFAQEFATQPILQRVIHSFIAAVALAVAAIPEGLPAVVTISLALGTQRMLKKNALVRKLNSIETLGSTDVICSDKTGTLTKGEMTVKQAYFNNEVYEIGGTGYDLEGAITKDGKAVENSNLSILFETGKLCNNARYTDVANYSGDPTEVALLVSAIKSKCSSDGERIFEIPFSSERKMMSVVVKHGKNLRIYAKGAPEILLNDCNEILLDGKVEKINDTNRKKILDANLTMSKSALRNLAFAYRDITENEFAEIKKSKGNFERNLIFVGIQGMIDPPREEVKSLVASCKSSGIRVIMITGDHVETAKAIAHEIGIDGGALLGEDLEKLSQEEYESKVEDISIYARVSPSSKMKIVEALKKRGHIVAMTGDGVNDAPALKMADIGIAMGIKGTDVAKEASDLILLDDNFSTIVAAIEEGRGIFQNIRKFVNYLLSCNIGEVLIVLFALIIFKDIPLTATMLLWINVVTDGLPAVALGMDPAEKDIMRYSPREFQKAILDKKAWVQMLFFGALLALCVLFIYDANLREGIHEAQGAAFLSIVVLELINVMIIRKNFKMKLLTNKWVIIAVVGSLALQLILMYIPFLAHIFEIKPIDVHDWIIIATSICSITIIALLFNSLSGKFMTSKPKS